VTYRRRKLARPETEVENIATAQIGLTRDGRVAENNRFDLEVFVCLIRCQHNESTA